MKYTPVQPPEDINVTPEHPLKSFFILTAGTIGVVILIVLILGFFADHLVKYVPVEYEQDLFSQDGIYLMPFETDESAEGIKVRQYLQSLVNELHNKAGEDFADHQFHVAVSSELAANAFAIPGGHIVVTKGLFSSIESENGLSMILAHEMAHHYKRHPLRSTGRGLVVSLFLLTVLGVDGSSFLQNILGSTASITNLAFSRKQESESDEFAIDLLNMHYGHASGASEFFQYIQGEEESMGEIPSFLSTHPSTDDRIEFLHKHENKNSGDKLPLPDHVRDYAHIIE